MKAEAARVLGTAASNNPRVQKDVHQSCADIIQRLMQVLNALEPEGCKLVTSEAYMVQTSKSCIKTGKSNLVDPACSCWMLHQHWRCSRGYSHWAAFSGTTRQRVRSFTAWAGWHPCNALLLILHRRRLSHVL